VAYSQEEANRTERVGSCPRSPLSLLSLFRDACCCFCRKNISKPIVAFLVFSLVYNHPSYLPFRHISLIRPEPVVKFTDQLRPNLRIPLMEMLPPAVGCVWQLGCELWIMLSHYHRPNEFEPVEVIYVPNFSMRKLYSLVPRIGLECSGTQ